METFPSGRQPDAKLDGVEGKVGFAVLLFFACGQGLLGCGGSTASGGATDAAPSGEVSADAAGGGTDAAGVGPEAAGGRSEAAAGRVPSKHRSTSSPACAPTPIPADPVIPDAGLVPGANFACHVNADCTQGMRGRCVLYDSTMGPSGIAGTQCVYDECLKDTDCPAGGVCSCDGNSCLAGNCRVDSDCGPGRFCSPSEDPCSSPPLQVIGYFCHTAADECIDNTDCDPAKFQSTCIFDMSVGHWNCPPANNCPQ
jgi:hypothetical protein